MSYDVQIGDFDGNYTFNVSHLFYDHIPETESSPGGLRALDGKTGREAAEILADAFYRIGQSCLKLWDKDVVGEPSFCARYDSPNGWGSTVGGLIFLAQILAACARHPDEIVRVCA